MIKVIKNSKYLILFCLLVSSSLILSQNQGSSYNGPYKKSGPIEYTRKSNIIIEGLEFENSKERSIVLWNCSNVIIRNCKFKNKLKDPSIYAYMGTNIQIINCTFENVHQAFVAGECLDNIKFEYNDVKNLVGDLYGGSKFSNAVSVIKSSGKGYSISYNAIENIPGESSTEDIINIYQSSGTAASPIMIKSNWIRGGGPSQSGGGIMMGDNGGNYQVCEDNILVNPGMYGIGIVGGSHHRVRNNKIYSAKTPYSGLAVQAANYTNQPMTNIIWENNQVNYTNKLGKIELAWFDTYIRGVITNWKTDAITYNPNLNEDILPEVIINRERKTEIDDPELKEPTSTEDSPITLVYSDRFDRIAIKYLVPSNYTPKAYAEGYSDKGQLLISMTLPRYNQSFPISVPKGDYFIKITYPELGKTETTMITIK